MTVHRPKFFVSSSKCPPCKVPPGALAPFALLPPRLIVIGQWCDFCYSVWCRSVQLFILVPKYLSALVPNCPDTSGPGAKCPMDTSVPVPKCPDTSAPILWCRSVLMPKCPVAEVSGSRNLTLYRGRFVTGFCRTPAGVKPLIACTSAEVTTKIVTTL